MTTTTMTCHQGEVELEAQLERLKDELACNLLQDAPRSKVSAIEDRIRQAWDALDMADDSAAG